MLMPIAATSNTRWMIYTLNFYAFSLYSFLHCFLFAEARKSEEQDKDDDERGTERHTNIVETMSLLLPRSMHTQKNKTFGKFCAKVDAMYLSTLTHTHRHTPYNLRIHSFSLFTFTSTVVFPIDFVLFFSSRQSHDIQTTCLFLFVCFCTLCSGPHSSLRGGKKYIQKRTCDR